METLLNVKSGLLVALQFDNLLFCFLGVTLGTIVGVLPGIGALSTISILLPITFYMDPTAAIIMLAGVFYGAQYGGSTASILLNIPGTATNAVTCLDGHPMAKQGRAGLALGLTTIVSFIGGSFAIIVLIFLAPVIAEVALNFAAPEYTAVILFGLIAASTMAGGSALKGLAMVCVGVIFGLVGLDLNTGVPRFQLGFVELSDGMSIVALAMGLFGVAEILLNLMRSDGTPFVIEKFNLRSMFPGREERKAIRGPIWRGALIGTGCGILPGTGATIASFLAYATERRLSKYPEKFGTGVVEGIAAPETANNASVQSAFIPTLSLGIPGDAVMAVMLGALMIHGIAPGPALVRQEPELFWGLIMSFWVGNIILLALNLPLIGIFVKILKIPYDTLYIAMLLFICLGVYSIRNNVFDVYLVILFGIIGVGMLLWRYPAAPLLLGFLLGPMLEENARRALLVSRGDFTAFFGSPVSAIFMCMSIAVILWSIGRPMVRWVGRRRLTPL
ncbi:MAG: tripartite tricarboxylate transporter permease [Martelella sp.]|uniref:tripartite tricarboxylate transporter permease n=1 Tax=Martelella sp. TaxID=1969699 RepID=UPI003242B33A